MSLYGVIGYHVTLSEGHKIAYHPYKETLVPHVVETLIYLSSKGVYDPAQIVPFDTDRQIFYWQKEKVFIIKSKSSPWIWKSVSAL